MQVPWCHILLSVIDAFGRLCYPWNFNPMTDWILNVAILLTSFVQSTNMVEAHGAIPDVPLASYVILTQLISIQLPTRKPIYTSA